MFYHTSGTYDMKAAAGADSWTNWTSILSSKYDQHSSTGLDPLFVDAPHRNFSVQPGSSALAKGFVNIDTSDIGLEDNFPYPPSKLFFDGFENGFGSWKTYRGTPGASTAQKHGEASSFTMDQDEDAIYRTFRSLLNKVAVVWMYDDASDTTKQLQVLYWAILGRTAALKATASLTM